MTKIKTVIVDDEAKPRKVLQFKLEQYCPELDVCGTAADVPEAYTEILRCRPRIVFLDIAMPSGSGFDLIDKFPSIDFEIIFVTGYNDFVLDALKVSAVDYLLKPVITEDLISAVQRATRRIRDREKIEHYQILRHNIDHLGQQETRMAIPGTQAYDFVRIAQLIRCEGWQKYTRLYLQDGTCLVSSYNIGVFREMLRSYGFFSTHKSHLINTHHIQRYLKEGTVIMTDGSRLPVARRKREEFVGEVISRMFPH